MSVYIKYNLYIVVSIYFLYVFSFGPHCFSLYKQKEEHGNQNKTVRKKKQILQRAFLREKIYKGTEK